MHRDPPSELHWDRVSNLALDFLTVTSEPVTPRKTLETGGFAQSDRTITSRMHEAATGWRRAACRERRGWLIARHSSVDIRRCRVIKSRVTGELKVSWKSVAAAAVARYRANPFQHAVG